MVWNQFSRSENSIDKNPLIKYTIRNEKKKICSKQCKCSPKSVIKILYLIRADHHGEEEKSSEKLAVCFSNEFVTLHSEIDKSCEKLKGREKTPCNLLLSWHILFATDRFNISCYFFFVIMLQVAKQTQTFFFCTLICSQRFLRFYNVYSYSGCISCIHKETQNS